MKLSEVNSTKTAQLIKSILYLVLFLTTYFFVHELFEEYFQGKTYFSASKQPLTVEDMPTLTICPSGSRTLEYGEDIWISTFTHYSPSIHHLVMGQNYLQSHTIHLEKLALITTWFSDCFALNFQFTKEFYQQRNKNTSLFDRMFYFDLIKISFGEDAKKHVWSTVELQITSKQNSFGAVIFQWFDGFVTPVNLRLTHFLEIAITNTKKYKYLQSTCSKYSFFECVESKLKLLETCQINGKICAPFSLPADIPICLTNKSQCWNNITELIFPKCMGEKSCEVEEYEIETHDEMDLQNNNEKMEVEQRIRRVGGADEVVSQLLEGKDKSVIFSLSFDDLDWLKGDRTKELQVDIFTEYYVSNIFSLIGNVGGQMGLFIGFSFIGCFVWSMKWIKLAWNSMSKYCVASE